MAETTHGRDLVPSSPTQDGYTSAPWIHRMKVIVVARVRLYREGLALVLTNMSNIEVVGACEDGPQAITLIAAEKPAVAIVDARLVTAPGLIPTLQRVCPSIRVVAFGVQDEASEILGCAEAGVAGYVSSEAGIAELLRVLAALERDELLCTPFVAATLLRRVTELSRGTGSCLRLPQPGPGTGSALSARELEIVALIEQGLMNKEIARSLGISLSTVKNHVHRILEKQSVTRRDDLSRRHRADLNRL
jgi:two-component system, NarL family, nitrate/nitrite response regulator NarL